MIPPSKFIAVVKALLVFLFASPCVACLSGVGLKVSSIFFQMRQNEIKGIEVAAQISFIHQSKQRQKNPERS